MIPLHEKWSRSKGLQFIAIVVASWVPVLVLATWWWHR